MTALTGPSGYAKLMGRPAMPSLIAGGGSPSVGALLLENKGAQGMLAALSGLALINVAQACGLGWFVVRRQIRPLHGQ